MISLENVCKFNDNCVVVFIYQIGFKRKSFTCAVQLEVATRGVLQKSCS